ncbi:MAG: M24 family metallopeptidase, partial [Nitrososphaerales archaeon]
HISGERTLEVGGWATDRKFRKGDTVMLDLQTSFNNYWSDLCRTFVVGKKPSKKQERVAETLVKALEKAEEIMKPGTKGKEVYGAVNDEIMKAGYPKLMHHAGHSIGLDDQEPPWFLPNSEEQLEEGSVCVVEPGIYSEDTWGVRLEDAYVITKKGCERISSYPRDLA